MASSLATASAVTKATAVPHSTDTNIKYSPISTLSFPLSRKPNLRFLSDKGFHLSRSSSTAVVKAQSNEVPVEESSNSSASSPPPTLATEDSISEFITQVTSLVKLVDSRDIVELHLKQLDCEVVIRKKEAMPHPPPPPAIPMASNYTISPPWTPPASPPPPAPVSSPSPGPATTVSPPPAKSPGSSLPPLKCPMAGTLYRSPGPGEPPFVKVGDKVQKGQVVCIIEAMKLMNEIEADQSGTIVEIIAEDGKPVSVDTPLLVIQP